VIPVVRVFCVFIGASLPCLSDSRVL
jgi:hypothetical protein